MSSFLPPLCLVLALAMAIAAFAMLAVGPPEPSVELHRVTAAGDETARDALEADLERQQLQRNLLLTCLFVGSGVMIATAFVTMRPR